MNVKNSLFGASRKIGRATASLAVAIALLAAVSVSSAQAQCRGSRNVRARRVFSQPVNYGAYPGYQARRVVVPQNVGNGYYGNGSQYYGNYPGYYDPYDQGPSKGKDVLAVGASVAGGALVGGLVGGKKGAIIGAAAGAALGAGIVVKRHRNYNNQYRYPYPF
jgi:hypothetical protein